jgi:hypothetical protein
VGCVGAACSVQAEVEKRAAETKAANEILFFIML